MTSFKHLLRGNYAPLTNRMSFIKTDIDTAVSTYQNWLTERKYVVREINGGLEDCLEALLPSPYPSKILFVETASQWTAMFKNDLGESYEGENVAKRALVYNVKISCYPNDYQARVNDWGGGYLSVFNPGRESDMERHIWLHQGDSSWEFDQRGEPYPFEDTAPYNSKFARDRFTPLQLENICKNFGIDAFNESYYKPQGKRALIVEHVRERYENEDSEGLAELRKKNGCDMFDESGGKTKYWYIPEVRMLSYSFDVHERNVVLLGELNKLEYFRVDQWGLIPSPTDIEEIRTFLSSVKPTSEKTKAQCKRTLKALDVLASWK